MKKILVFVDGGVVTNVTDIKGKIIPNAQVIDYDNLELGQCPICLSEMENPDKCETCGYDAEKDNWQEALKNTENA